MLREERLNEILNQLNLHNKVLSTDLSTFLHVSEDTIRRDLRYLAKTGKIIKVHGGAITKTFNSPFQPQTEIYAQEKKQQIAQKCILLLKNDMVVLTEGGTTLIELARMIPSNLKATFFTLSPLVALALAEHSNLNVITIGGKLNKDFSLVTGASAVNQLSQIKVDLCLSGCNALSVSEGLTDSDFEVVQVKMAMIRAAKQTAILTISEKLNTTQRMSVCPINQINYLITELSAESPELAPYRNLDFKIL